MIVPDHIGGTIYLSVTLSHNQVTLSGQATSK